MGFKKSQKSEEKGPPKAIKKLEEGVRGIVRVAETDLDGTRKIVSALPKIKGVGAPLAVAILRSAGIDENAIVGKMTDSELQKIEDVISNPEKFNIPRFLLNRSNDYETGKGSLVTSSTLLITRKTDIDMMKKIRCYKGIRHETGQPVRGQKTRGNFRRGAQVGVSKVALKAAAKGALKPGAPAPTAPAPTAAKPAAGAAKPAERKEVKK